MIKFIKEKLLPAIYYFFRRNTRLFAALMFLSAITYPVAIKIVETSSNKVFFDPSSRNNKPLPSLKLNRPNLGVYDQTGKLENANITFGHEFAVWENNTEQRQIHKAMDKSIKLGRYPLITLEPWNVIGEDNDQIMTNISNGIYDKVIKEVCTTINSYYEFAIINFAPEPDLADKSRYRWALSKPEDYKNGYKH